jgi:hypothetical protein
VKAVFLAKGLTDFPTDRTDVPEIQLAIPHAGSSHTKERYVTLQNGLLRIRRRAEPAALVALGDKFCHSWLNDRASSTAKRFHFRCTQVYAGYAISFGRQAGCGYRTDIAQPEYAYRSAHSQ